jgi:hypothetical protein
MGSIDTVNKIELILAGNAQWQMLLPNESYPEQTYNFTINNEVLCPC